MAVDLKAALGMLTTMLAAGVLSYPAPAGALGPKAPFTPPAAPVTPAAAALNAASAAEGSQDAGVTTALVGMRLRTHPMALIDGRWSRLGDTVRGGRIDSIQSEGVQLRHPDGRTEFLAWNLLPEPPASAPQPVLRNTAP